MFKFFNLACYGRFCVLFSSLCSTFQLPWSAWAVPPCCVCLPLPWSRTSRPCSSLPWFPWQSCATSSRSTSEWHPGKGTQHHHSGRGNTSCSAGVIFLHCRILHCREALCLNLVLSRLWHCLQVGQIHHSGNVSFYKCLCRQLFKEDFWEAWAGCLCISKGFWSSQDTKNPTGFCPPPRAVCWVCPRKCGDRTGKLKSACPGETGNTLSQGEAAECSITIVVLLAIKDPVCMSLLSFLGAF